MGSDTELAFQKREVVQWLLGESVCAIRGVHQGEGLTLEGGNKGTVGRGHLFVFK